MTGVVSVGDGCAGELAGGRPRHAVARGGLAGVRAGPGGAVADRAGEQVTEHVIGLRHARLRDTLHRGVRSEEHTSELQSRVDLVCRLLLEKKKKSLTRWKRTQTQMTRDTSHTTNKLS